MNTVLREGINWVGFVDWTVRDFHSYETRRGATYNAYLVQDEKTALIDTVKYLYADQLIANIEKHTPLDRIDYIVVNHGEPDHSSSLPTMVEKCPNATIVCDKKCVQSLSMHYDTTGWNFQVVSTGESISLGKRTLTFVETPMVHWPDSMVTYLPEEKILFSMDGFGQHYASHNRFDDEVCLTEVMEEAKIYYANIVMPYGKQVAKTLEAASNLEIEMIAPAHGVIWRSHIAEIVGAYQDWCVCKAAPKVVVVYDTMWESTAKMANAMIDGVREVDGVDSKLIFIRSSNLTQMVTEIFDAATVAFGSSTLNQQMMPMAGALLTYLKGLRPVGKAGFAFGSYGWGKGGPEAVDEELKAMKWDVLRDPLKSQFRPTPEVLEECRAAGKMLAEKALEIAG